MPFSRKALSALAAALTVAKVQGAMGPAFSTGPTSSDTYIAESWATLTLPSAPSDNSGDLSLWVGMGTSNGDLIQSIAENWDSSDWSLYAYTLISTSATTQEPIQATGSTGTAGTAVTFHYLYDDATGNYTQDVIVGGTVISTLSTSDGKAEGWGSAVECAAEDCGTVPAHTWSNVSIILNAAYADYIDTLALGTDVEATMTTSDGGMTWEVGTIEIPSFDFSTLSVVDSDDSSSTTTTTTTSAAAAASSGSAASSSSGSSPSGTTGSSGASSSGSPTTGSSSGSGSYGSSGSQASGSATGGYSGSSGSSTWGSSGSQSSGTASGGHHHGGGSSTWGSSGSQSSGSPSSGSSTWGSSGSQSSQGASSFYGGSSSDAAVPSWKRSRVFRAVNL